MCLKAELNSLLSTTTPHLLPCTGSSTEFIPGMVAGGPLGGRPPHCCDWMKINHVVSSYNCYKGIFGKFYSCALQKLMMQKVLK